jgi:hypothetical protein
MRISRLFLVALALTAVVPVANAGIIKGTVHAVTKVGHVLYTPKTKTTPRSGVLPKIGHVLY